MWVIWELVFVIKDKKMFCVFWGIFIIFVVGYFLSSFLDILVLFIVLLVVVIFLLVSVKSYVVLIKVILKGVFWNIVFFLVGMYVVVYGL